MSYSKVCLNCDAPFEAKRASARFCGEPCKNDWHAANRAASSQEPGQRVIHALDDVRGLQEEYKGDWTAICREHARRTLLTTGYLSAADFEALGIPDEHSNVPNAQIGGLASAGYMEAISFRRWSAEEKASRKSGKYWIYRITTKGKEKLAGFDGTESSGEVAPRAVESGEDSEPGDGSHGTGITLRNKSDAPPPAVGAGPVSSSPASEVLQLDLGQKSDSSPYGTIVDQEAA